LKKLQSLAPKNVFNFLHENLLLRGPGFPEAH
jgi:hypothetical protein